MTHLIWPSVFFALFCVGPIVVLPRTEAGRVREAVNICSLACLALAWISFLRFLWPVFAGGF